MEINSYGAYEPTPTLKIIPYRHHSNSIMWMVKILGPNELSEEFAVVAENGEEAAYLGLKCLQKHRKEKKKLDSIKRISLESEYEEIVEQRKEKLAS